MVGMESETRIPTAKILADRTTADRIETVEKSTESVRVPPTRIGGKQAVVSPEVAGYSGFRGEAIPPNLYRELGMTSEEYEHLLAELGREPSPAELAMYSVMWSEHCSYKSSRIHLKRFPVDAPQVLLGPGENAGVVDVGDGMAVAIRMESHNHPSAVEPKQGAATGVGGIIRDILSVGARPIALMDPLFFGDLGGAHVKMLFDGVVSGISSYGNSVGVPTVGGELTFLPCYEQNPLVNVVCVGVVRKDRIVLGKASYDGGLAVLLGSLTGRDGIGGVSILASSGFREGDEDKRPSVQVGDPFEEKRLIEACLDLAGRGLLQGLQDLGGAGLSCATSETAARGGTSMEVDVSKVPLRETPMSALEILTSESQERMLAIVAPEDQLIVEEVCRHHEVRAVAVGKVSAGGADGTGRLVVRDGETGEVVADVPAASLADGAIIYDRPMYPPRNDYHDADDPDGIPPPDDAGDDILGMLADPAWVYEQYDHQLWCATIAGPGGDAALLRLDVPGMPEAASTKAIALSTDSAPRLCALDPYIGAAYIVAESAINVACMGARPYALVDCLNFGNPEHEEVMWQLSRSVDGISDACKALSVPVVGGNVSLYNESGGRDINPTPVVTMLGLRKLEAGKSSVPTHPRLVEGGYIVLLGTTDTRLGGSRWAVDLYGRKGGAPPKLDLEFHGRLVGWIASLVAGTASGIREGSVSAVHDVSEGGIGVALAELCLWSGIGATVEGVSDHAELFSESASRVLACTDDPRALIREAERNGIPAAVLGVAGGERVVIAGLVDLDMSDVDRTWRGKIPRVMDIVDVVGRHS
ncbi:MAG: phosphoribosylformylglycinamidine synthase subunit PurL [Actinobacteria bacterium]|nr:phosphoribosylformylglycinamidine synthase subunit PurL [Actinomycetota bacterium]